MNRKIQEEYREICRANGWRCTHQRFVLYSFMHGNKCHPSVDEAWTAVRKEIPSITRESVFRILCEFAERGLIARIDNLSSARFDSNPKPHGHFICKECGAIFDFDLPRGFNVSPALKGATVSTLEVRVTGLCPKHSNTKKERKRKK